jgi:hypothetical protein
MVVEVEGTVDALAGTGTARAIRIVGQLAGPVASVDAPAGRFVALGVVVETDASTVWSTTDGIASLGAGGPVEAWGFLDAAAGVLRASRVDARGDVEGLAWLRGQASGYDRAAARVIVGGQLVDLRAAGALPERIDDGTEVRVAGTAGAPGQPLRATRLEVVRSRLPDDVAEARVEGAVSRFESPARFAVTGLDVDASGATVTGGTADALRNGARVRVLGSVSGGAIVARVVEIRGPARGNAGGTNRPDGAGDGGAGGSADGSGTPDASAGSNGGNGNGNGNASAARAAEDPAQVRGSIVSAADPSAIVIRDGHGREFVVDASAGRIIGGTAADLAPGVAVVATGLRATVLRAATIRIER